MVILFKGFESYFSKMICEILEGENASFYRNLFMNMDYRASRKVAPHTRGQKSPHDPHKEHKQDAKELLELIDRTTLKVKNDHEIGITDPISDEYCIYNNCAFVSLIFNI